MRFPNTRSAAPCPTVKPSPSSRTAGSPVTLRFQRRSFSIDLPRGQNHNLKSTRFQQRTPRMSPIVSPPPRRLRWSRVTPPSPSSLMNAHQGKWKSRTTSLSFPSASSESRPQPRSQPHPQKWCQCKAKLLIGWSRAMPVWWGDGHSLKTCTAPWVTRPV